MLIGQRITLRPLLIEDRRQHYAYQVYLEWNVELYSTPRSDPRPV